MDIPLKRLAEDLEGALYTDEMMRTLYATDASAYRELPLAVAIPKTEADIRKLISFARSHQTSLIPRTAGTSLAGQVVGKGIVVDVSKHFTRILELNVEESWVRVEPGVIRDELNLFLKPYGLFFGPETSTANRAMIGGMVGNNSCGSNSIVYRSTREHLLELSCFLSDGTRTEFKSLSTEAFHEKCDLPGLEGDIYRHIRSQLSDYGNQERIRREFPKKTIERRNTGYALDILLDTDPFIAGAPPFNFCSLIAGSEGTLAFLTEIKLQLSPLPPPESVLLCAHFHDIDQSLRANLIGLRFQPHASELMDHYILECTKENIEQKKNRFFVQGDPGAILVIEYRADTREAAEEKARKAEQEMRAAGLGYHFPLIFGDDAKKVWNLRKAGLGLLGNMPGDEKAVPVIEDTAVDVQDLPQYIRDFNEILKKYGLYSVHYAHAGSGELHLRPIINLKTEAGNRLFRSIAEEIAVLVKKYRGSLSGEHGDGRLRGEFIRLMVGEENYTLMQSLKNTWDPDRIFNPHKIVDTPPMDSMLRYEPGKQTPAHQTHFRFYRQNILQHAEQCNGSGDCRKTHLSGGTMCPSYMATRNEKDTTRARANMLREVLTHATGANPYDHDGLYEVMDLCLSCKACKAECPSNVDVAKLKAEFLQHYYDRKGTPFRARLIAGFSRLSALGALVPALYNFVLNSRLPASWIKRIAGFAPSRSLPLLYHTTLRSWFQNRKEATAVGKGDIKGEVWVFCDEFTNYNDTVAGIRMIELLEALGYRVDMPTHLESGRASLSKGLVRKARNIIRKNIDLLGNIVSSEKPLIGLEPSAILTFRDEYIDLAADDQLDTARRLASHVFTIDEFLAAQVDQGKIEPSQFTKSEKKILLHGHCQQKALSSIDPTRKILSLPQNYKVEVIASGCCGMAGSFGYEAEHYDLSMQIGEMVLFPAVRKAGTDTLIAAPGTSCRHQIMDGTGIKASHPVEILWEALKTE